MLLRRSAGNIQAIAITVSPLHLKDEKSVPESRAIGVSSGGSSSEFQRGNRIP